ncbi:hypothetical protein GCM10027415_01500 [Humibacter ginsengisoli]
MRRGSDIRDPPTLTAARPCAAAGCAPRRLGSAAAGLRGGARPNADAGHRDADAAQPRRECRHPDADVTTPDASAATPTRMPPPTREPPPERESRHPNARAATRTRD